MYDHYRDLIYDSIQFKNEKFENLNFEELFE